MKDYNNDMKVWRNPITLSTSYQTVTLDPANDGVYRPGHYGARDGFDADKVKSIEIRIINVEDSSSPFTGTLWIDDLKYNP